MLYTDLRLKMTLMCITLGLFNHFDSARTDDVSQPNPVLTADVGEDVTLHCFRLEAVTSGGIVWYKQKFGHEPRVMVSAQHEPDYKDEFKPPKFSVKLEQRSCHLKITNVETSDEAMYYCGLRTFLTTFGNGTFLSVKGDGDVNVSVSQMGVWDSVPAGASVTLQCSVLSESRAAELQVLWFRAAPPQSHPQIIYTHHNSSRQCESGSSTHTCVYNLSKNILSLNDTGTYYCAVVACGRIILGNGTRVELERSVNPVVICLTAALGVCAVVIIALIFIIICKGANCEPCRGRLRRGSVPNKTPSQDGDNVELNYAALHFTEKRAKPGRVTKQQPQDIIYSDVRRPNIT